MRSKFFKTYHDVIAAMLAISVVMLYFLCLRIDFVIRLCAPLSPSSISIDTKVIDGGDSISVGFFLPTVHNVGIRSEGSSLRYDIGLDGIKALTLFQTADKEHIITSLDFLNNVEHRNIVDAISFVSTDGSLCIGPLKQQCCLFEDIFYGDIRPYESNAECNNSAIVSYGVGRFLLPSPIACAQFINVGNAIERDYGVRMFRIIDLRQERTILGAGGGD